jgi:hypothetical protein
MRPGEKGRGRQVTLHGAARSVFMALIVATTLLIMLIVGLESFAPVEEGPPLPDIRRVRARIEAAGLEPHEALYYRVTEAGE